MRAVEMVVPVQVMSDFIELPKPQQEAPPPPKPQVKTPTTPVRQEPVRAAAPVPLAIADATPAPQAPVGVVAAQAVLPPLAAPVAATAVTAPAPKVELPSSDAEYLHNPKPEYPRLSKQRGEQGKVVVNVFIGADGSAQKAEIKSSSGFERLDQAALATVKAWRYAPGKRGGVAEAMWFAVPLNFVLE
jgi:protein TonB